MFVIQCNNTSFGSIKTSFIFRMSKFKLVNLFFNIEMTHLCQDKTGCKEGTSSNNQSDTAEDLLRQSEVQVRRIGCVAGCRWKGMVFGNNGPDIAIREAFRKNFGFKWNGSHYVFNVLPFGFVYSPLIFTKSMVVLVGYMRESYGAVITYYMDDITLAAPSEKELLRIMLLWEKVMKIAGVVREPAKGCWSPAKHVEVLGFIVHPPTPSKINLTKKVKKIPFFKKNLTKGPWGPGMFTFNCITSAEFNE